MIPGLTSEEAARLLAEYGPNTTKTESRFWVIRSLSSLLLNPLVLILLAAAAVSGAVGDFVNAILIGLMVVLSIGLDFYQMFQSEQAATKLRSLVAPTARVLRDGSQADVPVETIVPGDVIDVRAGDLVPADATIVQSTTLAVDEAALTGESLPVEKKRREGPSGELFAGTSIVSGVAMALVTATGHRTEFGTIARSLVERAPPTEFEVGTRRFGFLIMRTVVGLILFVFFVNALLRRDPLESFLFALALAVGLTPEFLPMITTVTLSRGAMRMAQGKVIVKRLEAIENLGSMDVLCSDKTGTLTQGRVSLQQHVDIDGQDSALVLQWACVNSALETGIRSPLDEAILSHDHPAIPTFTKKAELPFDFERRRVSVLADGPEGTVIIAKGAPESVLPLCTRLETASGPLPLTDEAQHRAIERFEGLSRAGFHTLAIAWKPAPPDQLALTPSDECEMVLSGFAAFMDPPDDSAATTISDLARVGVSVKILTGDGELVARAICNQVGLSADRVATGDEIARASDEALGAIVERANLFARVSPAEKHRIILALKRRRHVVGYIGDGINDAPSLHAADVGISVSNGVEVAKAAADIILLERSLAAVYRGVVEGRRSFGNITKYVLMGTSSNFGNMLSMAVASAFLPFLPLLAVQILLNNFLYDMSQVTIPTDNVDDSYVLRPRKWDTRLIQRFMLTLGPVSSIYDLLTFAILLWVFQTGPSAFRAGWFIESLATQTLVIFVIRTAKNPFESRPSNALLASVIGAVAVGFLIVESPIGGAIGFTPPPPLFLAALLIMVPTYLLIVERVKRALFA
jgi:P-type Mg2+ transporter